MRAIQQTAVRGGAPDARHEPLPTVGPWRLTRLLGVGEWCQVFQAAPRSIVGGMTADYVVKLILPSQEREPQAIALLQNEAFVAGQTTHPHLVCVLSAHVDRPPFYLVMPFQHGVTLREYLRRHEPLPLANCLWIARQVAEGASALHEKGWAHCDVKPDNVQIAPNGHATLCDLGLACPLDRTSRPRDMIVGTPAYMPPEAFAVDGTRTAAADCYSLGVMLYEMLTGRRPFPHQDGEELMAAHRLVPAPDPRLVRPDVPANVARLVRSLMAKEPMRRPSGRDLIDLLVDAEVDLFDQRCVA